MRLTMSLIAFGLGVIFTIHLRSAGPTQFIILAVKFFVSAILKELGW
jgi:hypothetical protein